MKSILLLISGFLLGFWFSWPGITSYKSWECFFQIVEESKKEKLSLKTILAVSPVNILRRKNKDYLSKIRIVSDICFRY
tara:strand:+ start:3808 stop:4044 length:237 start_codon:yes stop_codon:yes gene_type:complete